MIQPWVDSTAKRAICRLSGAGLDADTLLREIAPHLQQAIPFETAAALVYDPETVLATAVVPLGETLSYDVWLRYCANEQLEDDVNKFRDLARQRVPVSTIARATGGAPEVSRRFQALLRPRGLEHELRVALVSGGSCWGSIALNRDRGAVAFNPSEESFAAAISAPLAEGLCQAALRAAADAGRPDGPGVLVLDPDGSVASATDAAAAWLELLGDEPRAGNYPPPAVASVGIQTRSPLTDGPIRAGVPPRVRVRTRMGQWLILHGALSHGPNGPDGRVIVVVQGAQPGEVLPVVARRFNLTPREQTLVRLLLQGLATPEISQRMQITPNTVQDHLKSIFDKTGVRSRRELAHALALSLA